MLEETFAATFDSDSDWFELAMNVNIAKHAAVLRRAVGHTCMPSAHVPDDGCAFRQDEVGAAGAFHATRPAWVDRVWDRRKPGTAENAESLMRARPNLGRTVFLGVITYRIIDHNFERGCCISHGFPEWAVVAMYPLILNF